MCGIWLGKKKGHKVKRLGSLGLIIDINPQTTAPLCATIEGFSLHAGVYCAPNERKKLEKVARYIARPAVVEDRLRFDT
ncbi:MAG: transposase [Bdellovibrionota bacterium]|mgnify:CR=1 FL=1